MTLPPFDFTPTAWEDEKADPLSSVRAWAIRMAMHHGPKVWDQEHREWLTWEQALSRHLYGKSKVWLLDHFVWTEKDLDSAKQWEAGPWWPLWAVKATAVGKRPCDFDDHQWILSVDMGTVMLKCLDTCTEPRVFYDGGGRYLFPVCQNVPDLDSLKLEVAVDPEWVYCAEDEWWVELHPQREET